MDLRPFGGTREPRFDAYFERLCSTERHADRLGLLLGYCLGLMTLGDCKCVEPMAARVGTGGCRQLISRCTISSPRPTDRRKRGWR